jgi:hypothetical protein
MSTAPPAPVGSRSCAFCGSTGSLTREHVLGNWLSKIGLPSDRVESKAGPLNRLSKSLGVAPPFQMTVKNVCATCNNGWMERLEAVAQRVLTPLILGEPGQIDPADQGAIATWLQKTALVAMLISSAEDREQGYGLPPSEYELLYAQRESMEPLPSSMFWVGRHTGELRLGSVRVTPLSLNVDGLPESDIPHAYSMTIALGELILHGIRFTSLPFYVDIATQLRLEQIWPAMEVPASLSLDVTEDEFLPLSRGRGFVVSEPALTLQPWKPATELPEGDLVGSTVELPALCGKHVLYYPPALVHEAMAGRFYWFMTGCECEVGYLIRTETDGAHAMYADTPELIEAQYEAIVGEEFIFEDANGPFFFKRVE